MNGQDLVDYLGLATQCGASDLHLTAGLPPMVRINGVIQPLTEGGLTGEATRELVLGVLKEAQRAELEREWQLDFSIQVEGLGRFRGNACYVMGNMEINLRRIPEEIPDLAALGHSPVVEQWCEAKAGLVLVTGASGSGKTTTLASMAQTIATRRQVNLVSIEDPVEFVLPAGRSIVNQREIGTDARSFPDALRNALRQDADVILIGEMRDTETIRTALLAAETGHLVIGTMHTLDAPTAIGRMLDAYPEEHQRFVGSQLSWALLGVVCQYLLPRSDTPGLVLASELMTVSTGIESCIRDRRLAQIPGMIQIGGQEGMHTVDDSLVELLLVDKINLQDAMAHARDPEFVKQQFQEALKHKRKGWFGRLLGR